jgi:DNA end-binding protein Ku
MAPAYYWKGYLKLSLVTCPVAMMPAISASEKVRFHTINRATGHRIRSRYVDAVTGKPVDDDDQVRGYPKGDDEYVMLEDEELDAVALESTRTIDIDRFVPQASVDWIWYDTPHFLVPSDKVGEEAFSVIREAMKASKTAGLSRLVLYRRERAVMLVPHGKGIVLWTLRYGDEVRDEKEYFAGIAERKLDPKLKRLVASLIDGRTEHWSPTLVRDPVQEKLLDIIRAKDKGRKPAKSKAASPRKGGNVVNIMDALKKSLQQGK